MIAKHTLGPWEMDDELQVCAHNNFVALCAFHSYTAGRSWNEAYANATLIAAAPTLARELAELVLRCDGNEGVREDGSNIDTRGAHAALRLAGYDF